MTDDVRDALSPSQLNRFFTEAGLEDQHVTAIAQAADAVLSEEGRPLLDYVERMTSQISASERTIAEDEFLRLPLPPDDIDPAVRAMLVPLSFIAGYSRTREAYRSRHIPAEILRDTMKAFQDSLSEHADETGVPGFFLNSWMIPFFRAEIFQLGRLQFRFEAMPVTVHVGGMVVEEGASALSVHIPPHGPLDPSVVQESFRCAEAFFPRHFPEYSVNARFICSWLLDPQLSRYLKPDSNILRFQRLWHPVPGFKADDEQFFKNVFPGQEHSWDTVVAKTSLQKILVQHVRDGGRWYESMGVLRGIEKLTN